LDDKYRLTKTTIRRVANGAPKSLPYDQITGESTSRERSLAKGKGGETVGEDLQGKAGGNQIQAEFDR
jgi:hypothetical protein